MPSLSRCGEVPESLLKLCRLGGNLMSKQVSQQVMGIRVREIGRALEPPQCLHVIQRPRFTVEVNLTQGQGTFGMACLTASFEEFDGALGILDNKTSLPKHLADEVEGRGKSSLASVLDINQCLLDDLGFAACAKLQFGMAEPSFDVTGTRGFPEELTCLHGISRHPHAILVQVAQAHICIRMAQRRGLHQQFDCFPVIRHPQQTGEVKPRKVVHGGSTLGLDPTHPVLLGLDVILRDRSRQTVLQVTSMRCPGKD